MPTAKSKDKYANLLTHEITMSAANTFTVSEVDVGLSLFDKAGIVINRIEYHVPGGVINEMTATGDYFTVGILTNDSATSLDPAALSTIDAITVRRMDMGTAGAVWVFSMPIVRDYSMLPSGGIIITPRPWFVGMTTAGVASAGTCTVRFFFTIVKLSGEDYFELLETRHHFG